MKQFLAAFLLLSLSASAQTPNAQWLRPLYGSSAGVAPDADITDIDTDPIGNTYLCGIFKGVLQLAPGTTLTAAGNDPALFLAKYTADGALLWAKKGAPQSPAATGAFSGISLDTDGEGNVYWCGNFIANQVDFGDGLILSRQCTNNCQEGFLLKIGPGGQVVFSKKLRAALGFPFKVAGIGADLAGNHYLTGSYEGTELWMQGGANIGGLSSEHFYLTRFKASGDADWILLLPDNSGAPEAQAIAVAPDGARIAVSGVYQDPSLYFGNMATTSSADPAKQFLAWFSNGGQALDAATLSSSTATLELSDITMDAQYQLWGVAHYSGALRYNGNAVANAAAGALNSHVLKLSAGSITALNSVGHSNSSLPLNTLTLSSSGQYITAGFASNALSIGAGFQGCKDVLLCSGNSNNLQWARYLGQSGCESTDNNDYGTLIGADGAGNIYLAGAFQSGIQFDGLQASGSGLFLARLGTGMTDTREADRETLQVFPNPAGSSCTLSLEQAGRLRIFSAQGVLVQEHWLEAGMAEMTLTGMPPGWYVLQFQDAQGRSRRQPLLIGQ